MEQFRFLWDDFVQGRPYHPFRDITLAVELLDGIYRRQQYKGDHADLRRLSRQIREEIDKTELYSPTLSRIMDAIDA